VRLDHNLTPVVSSSKHYRLQDIQLFRLAPRAAADDKPWSRTLQARSFKRCAAARHAPGYAGAPDVRTLDGRCRRRARHRTRCRPPTSFPVAIGEGSHPFPFRTRKLSPPPPMVLQAQVCGRVGHCRGYIEARRVVTMRRAFSFLRGREPLASRPNPGPPQGHERLPVVQRRNHRGHP
jgi:hypothetical protein